MLFGIKEHESSADSSVFEEFLGTCDAKENGDHYTFETMPARSNRQRENLMNTNLDVLELIRRASASLIPDNSRQLRRRPRICSESTKTPMIDTLTSMTSRFLGQAGLRFRRSSAPTSTSDYRSTLELRYGSRHASATSTSDASMLSRKSSLASNTIAEYECPHNCNSDSCRVCSVNRRRKTFLEKIGKFFVVPEYLQEEQKVKVVVSQYGTVKIDGHQGNKSPDVTLHVKIKLANGKTRSAVKKLDCCRNKNEFRFNYMCKLDCEAEEISRKDSLVITLKYKKAFFNKRSVINKLSMNLNDLETGLIDTEEYLLY